MLNPFPIQFLALFAYFILRVCVGVVLLRLGAKHTKGDGVTRPGRVSRAIGVIEIAAGLMLIFGFYTQIAALIMVSISLKTLVFHTRLAAPGYGRSFYLLILGASLSLLITGAGFFAFDLPI